MCGRNQKWNHGKACSAYKDEPPGAAELCGYRRALVLEPLNEHRIVQTNYEVRAPNPQDGFKIIPSPFLVLFKPNPLLILRMVCERASRPTLVMFICTSTYQRQLVIFMAKLCLVYQQKNMFDCLTKIQICRYKMSNLAHSSIFTQLRP